MLEEQISRCETCSYYWADEGEEFLHCHYESKGNWDPAPCEYDSADPYSGDDMPEQYD